MIQPKRKRRSSPSVRNSRPTAGNAPMPYGGCSAAGRGRKQAVHRCRLPALTASGGTAMTRKVCADQPDQLRRAKNREAMDDIAIIAQILQAIGAAGCHRRCCRGLAGQEVPFGTMTSSTGTDAAVETAATPIPAYLALYLSSNSPPRFAGAAFSWRSGKGAPATLWAETPSGCERSRGCGPDVRIRPTGTEQLVSGCSITIYGLSGMKRRITPDFSPQLRQSLPNCNCAFASLWP